DKFWQAWVKLRLGEMWYEQGQSEKALLLITEAFQTAEEVQNRVFLAAVLYHWGIALLNQTDWAAAEAKFQRAYDLWQEKGKTENALSALAGLAYVAYQQEDGVTAVTHAENLWQAWQKKPIWAERANLKLYWQLGTVWDGSGDSRANDLWPKAHALLRQRSQKIPDAEARKKFLEQVPVHQAILHPKNNSTAVEL
ncbi:MAG: tetratricopeptide repeat protein, partial [Anaerolineae bacterium]